MAKSLSKTTEITQPLKNYFIRIQMLLVPCKLKRSVGGNAILSQLQLVSRKSFVLTITFVMLKQVVHYFTLPCSQDNCTVILHWIIWFTYIKVVKFFSKIMESSLRQTKIG